MDDADDAIRRFLRSYARPYDPEIVTLYLWTDNDNDEPLGEVQVVVSHWARGTANAC